MKKLALSLILALCSVTAAFAQSAGQAEVSTTASVQQLALPTQQDLNKVAFKSGEFVAGVFRGTFEVGASLLSGLKAGVLGADVKVDSAATSNEKTIDVPSKAFSQEAPAVKVHTPAPVEDRSIYVSSAN